MTEPNRNVHPAYRAGCWPIVIVLFLLSLFIPVVLLARHKHVMPIIKDQERLELQVLERSEGFHPYDLVVTSEGTVFATDPTQGCVWRWRSIEGLDRYVEGLQHPETIAADDAGTLWVNEARQPRIYRIDAARTVSIMDISGMTRVARDLTYDPNRKALLALDAWSRRIIEIGRDGAVKVLCSDESTSMLTRMGEAVSFTPAERGGFYVLNFQFRLLAIDASEKRWLKQIDRGFTEYVVWGSMAYHRTTGLIVQDMLNGRILRMREPTVALEVLYETNEEEAPMTISGIAVSSDGVVFLCDEKNGLLARLRR